MQWFLTHPGGRAVKRWQVAMLGVLGWLLIGSRGPSELGSGLSCSGLGYGCDPEPYIDTALVAAVWAFFIVVAVVVAHRRIVFVAVLAAVVAAGLSWWWQVPRYHFPDVDPHVARAQLERVLTSLAETNSAAATGARERSRPCLDAMDRPTGGVEWWWYEVVGSPTPPPVSDELRTVRTAVESGGLAAVVQVRTTQHGQPTSWTLRAIPSYGAGYVHVLRQDHPGEVELRASTGCIRP